MKTRTKLIIAGGAVVAAALAGATAAQAASVTDDEGGDTAITGPDLERATEAALAHLGEGEVTETEVGDEESYYEVEVRLPDGRQVDVQLDEDFQVVGTEGDGSGGDD
jgi:uncharacterized membrane protein YkoI